MIKIGIDKKKGGESVWIETAEADKTLLDILQEAHIYLDAPCGGKGNCGRCRVRFVSGAPLAGERERRLLTDAELRDGIRLACMARPDQDCRIILPGQMQESMEVLTASGGAQDPTEMLTAAGGERRQDESGMAYKKETGYGIAVDIGTTTLAAALLDLQTGAQKAVASFVNRQRAYGADVISRIQAANAGKGELLQECIKADILQLFELLLRRAQTAGADVSCGNVKKIVIAGNTTMCHLLRGLSCAGLGAAPFTPVDISLWEGTARALFPGAEEWTANVTILPGISVFVGADIVAGMYACDMDLWEHPGLLLDIGTNGEMAVGNRNGCFVASAAAGPVFEGGNISCGVAGIPGAVTHVALICRSAGSMAQGRTKSRIQTGSLPGGGRTSGCLPLRSRYETIGGIPPVGLCGTGIIDAVGELLRTGLIDKEGLLCEPWFAVGVPVAGDGIRFTQRDIREVQTGKAAIRAGIEILLLEYGKKGAETRGMPVSLAGGFGYAMDVGQAIRIGLFPQTFRGCVRAAGNTALEGAKKYLLAEEQTAKQRVARIVSGAVEINLAVHPEFHACYVGHMGF